MQIYIYQCMRVCERIPGTNNKLQFSIFLWTIISALLDLTQHEAFGLLQWFVWVARRVVGSGQGFNIHYHTIIHNREPHRRPNRPYFDGTLLPKRKFYASCKKYWSLFYLLANEFKWFQTMYVCRGEWLGKLWWLDREAISGGNKLIVCLLVG